MKKILLPFFAVVIYSCNHDLQNEKLELYTFQLKVDSFISVYEDAARINYTVPIYVTLVGNGNPYENQYVINMDEELIIEGLIDKEYTLYANTHMEEALYYKEFKFNPVQTPSQNIILEGIVTKFSITPTSWPEICNKMEVNLSFDEVSMIDETGFYLNTIYSTGGQHNYSLVVGDDPKYYYATPFRSHSFEVILYDEADNKLASKEVALQKQFEKLKSYNIKIDLAEMFEESSSSSFSLEDLFFDEVEVIL